MWVGPRVFDGMKFDRIMAGLTSLSQLLYVECNRTHLRLQGSFLIGKIWITTFTPHYTSKETCKQTSVHQEKKKKKLMEERLPCWPWRSRLLWCEVLMWSPCGREPWGTPRGWEPQSYFRQPPWGLGKDSEPQVRCWKEDPVKQPDSWSTETDTKKKCIGLNHLSSW